jgi:hypothetical protein
MTAHLHKSGRLGWRCVLPLILTAGVAIAPVSLAHAAPASEQRSIARVQLMPAAPDPLVVRDWPQVSRQYYELILAPARRLDGKPLVVLQTDPPACDIPSWVGGKPGKD